MGPGRIIGDAYYGGDLMPTIDNAQSIGSSSLRWKNIYAASLYGNLSGNATTATKANTATDRFGIAYYDSTDGKFASTLHGNANTALMGKGNAEPEFVSVTPSISITDGTADNAPKINLTVLGVSGQTAAAITKATTDLWGVTKLSNTSSTTEEGVAATPKGVWAAIGTLNYTTPATSGTDIAFVTIVDQSAGKIVTSRKTVRDASTEQSGVVSTGAQTFAGNKFFNGITTFNNNTTTTGVATFNGNVAMNSSASADSLTAGSLIVSGNTSLVNTSNTSTLLPHSHNAYNVGADGNRYATVYAMSFNGVATKATAANIATAANSITYYTDIYGTFGSKASANGALYATSSNGALQWGTLPVGQGGTGVTTFASGELLIGNGANAIGTRAITNNTANTAVVANTNIPTMNTIYYGLTVINNASQSRANTIYAPTGAGTASNVLISAGGTNAPGWYSGLALTGTAAGDWITTFNGTTDSSTYTGNTGAVRILGGASIAKKLYVGSSLNVLGATLLNNNLTVTGVSTFNGNVAMNSSVTADSLTAGSLVVSGNSSLVNTANTATLLPHAHNTYSIGADGNRYLAMYAGTFYGNATTASKLGTSTVGGVLQPIYLNGGTATVTNYFVQNTKIANGTNANTLQTTGRFCTNYNHSITNLPSTNAMEWGLDVIATRNVATGDTYSWQIAYPAYKNPGKIYVRQTENNSYTNWYPLVMENSGTWSITADKANKDGNGSVITSTYLKLTGGTMSGTIMYSASRMIQWTSNNNDNNATGCSWYGFGRYTASDGYQWLCISNYWGINFYCRDAAHFQRMGQQIWAKGDSVTSAVWNDYAEYRNSYCTEPGRVVMEKGDDSLIVTQERMSHFAGVVSDTWGFAQGETEHAKTPIAVAGRVLVYPFKDRKMYHPGDCVCAAPNGTVDIMTREEIVTYPDRIVGTVSCVPDYDTWGGGDRDPVKVNGRIWIKVR